MEEENIKLNVKFTKNKNGIIADTNIDNIRKNITLEQKSALIISLIENLYTDMKHTIELEYFKKQDSKILSERVNDAIDIRNMIIEKVLNAFENEFNIEGKEKLDYCMVVFSKRPNPFIKNTTLNEVCDTAYSEDMEILDLLAGAYALQIDTAGALLSNGIPKSKVKSILQKNNKTVNETLLEYIDEFDEEDEEDG